MTTGLQYHVTASLLNLRGARSKSAPVIARLPRGTTVAALEQVSVHPTWIRVSVDGRTGYVAHSFLEPAGPPGSAAQVVTQVAGAVDSHRRDTDSSRLHPLVRQAVAAILEIFRSEANPLRVFEAYRTPERQAFLYAQGRGGQQGKIVTKADVWQSYHQYGLAADFVALENGRWSWDDSGTRSDWWRQLHKLADEHDMEPLKWELPHVQLKGVKLADLQAGRFPEGGDDDWWASLETAMARSIGDPRAPRYEFSRPPLSEI